jgi:hypothetical protein
VPYDVTSQEPLPNVINLYNRHDPLVVETSAGIGLVGPIGEHHILIRRGGYAGAFARQSPDLDLPGVGPDALTVPCHLLGKMLAL